jgi:hypothetical protein
MARVERADEWVTAVPKPELLQRIDDFLASENMQVTRLSEDSLYISRGGGSHAMWRGLRMVTGFRSYPCVGSVELAATESGTRLSVRIEESFGAGNLDSRSRRKYDASFAGWLQRFRDAVPPTDAPEGSSVDIAGRIEKLVELHAQGALTDAEFAAAKADVLSSGQAGGEAT